MVGCSKILSTEPAPDACRGTYIAVLHTHIYNTKEGGRGKSFLCLLLPFSRDAIKVG